MHTFELRQQHSTNLNYRATWVIWSALFGLTVVCAMTLTSITLREYFGLTVVLTPIPQEMGWFILIGSAAQLVDGAFGMAYGVTVTTLLLSMGIPGLTPAVASASMHASEVLTTGTSDRKSTRLNSSH